MSNSSPLHVIHVMVFEKIITPFILLFSYRKNILEGVQQELKSQYSGSALGIFWVLFFPLCQLAIYCALYVFIFRVRPPGLTQWSYVVLVFSGLVPLLAFNQALQSAMSSLVANRALLSSTAFPVNLIVIRTVVTAQLPMLCGMLITIIMAFGMQRTDLFLTLFYIPILWLNVILFATGLGLIFSLVTLIIKDLQHSIGLALMLMTFLSPFAYTPEMVPAGLKIILFINPMTYFVRAFQEVLCYGIHPELINIGVSTLLGVGSYIFGYTVFEHKKSAFFDYA